MTNWNMEAEDEIDLLGREVEKLEAIFRWMNNQKDIQIWLNRNKKFSIVINDERKSIKEGYFIEDIIMEFIDDEVNYDNKKSIS